MEDSNYGEKEVVIDDEDRQSQSEYEEFNPRRMERLGVTFQQATYDDDVDDDIHSLERRMDSVRQPLLLSDPYDSSNNSRNLEEATTTTTTTVVVLFFGCGLGSSLCYIATMSCLVYFSVLYGPNIYVYLNLAVYVPLVPIALAQARWDQYMDRIYKSNRTFLVRGVIAFAISIVGTAVIPFFHGPKVLLVGAILQGSGGAVLLGTLNQLASFTATTGRLKASVSAGVQASALLVLLISMLTGFGGVGSQNDDTRMRVFFVVVTVFECIFFGAFLHLMLLQPRVRASMVQRDSSITLPRAESNGSLDCDNQTREQDNDDEEVVPLQQQLTQTDLSYRQLLEKSWECCLTLIITLVPSFLVGSWFTHVHTRWIGLPQVLFYARIGADFVGRIATVLSPPKSIQCLQVTSILRLIPVILFFWNASLPSTLSLSSHDYASSATPQHNIARSAILSGILTRDTLSILLVTVIAFFSGYLVTGCFQLAPGQLTRETHDANVAKQASVLNVAFSIAALCGLISSFGLIQLGF